MSVIIKSNELYYKNPQAAGQSNPYTGINLFAERSTTNQIAAVISEGAAQVSAIISKSAAKISAINAAAAAGSALFPSSYEAVASLSSDFAPAYDNTTIPYEVGDYCTYQYQLYKCKTAIPSNNESFTPSHWTAVNAAKEINNVKDTLSYNLNSYCETELGFKNLLGSTTWRDKQYINASGSEVDDGDFYRTENISIDENLIWKLVVKQGSTNSTVRVHGYDINGAWIKQIDYIQMESAGTVFTHTFNISNPNTIKYIRISAKKDVEILHFGSVTTLKDSIIELTCKYYPLNIWELGGIDIGSGVPASNSIRLRSNCFLPASIYAIDIPTEYYISFRAYDKTTLNYVGAWNGKQMVTDPGTEWFTSGLIKMHDLPNYYYKLVVKNQSGSTIAISDGSNIKFYNNISKQNIIEVGSGKDFTKIRDGVASAVAVPNTKVYVHPGEYILTTEFASEISANTIDKLYGIKLENDVEVIFMPGSKVKALYNGINSNVTKCFQPFYAGNNGGYTIRGLDIEASNTRYCIHDENGPGTTYRKVNIIDCKFKLTVNGVDTSYQQCIGGGLGSCDFINISNCYFNTIYSTSSSSFITMLSYHNQSSTYGSSGQSKITIENCYFTDKGRIRLGRLGSTENKTFVLVNNCSMGDAIAVTIEAGSPPENFELVEFNNIVRSV